MKSPWRWFAILWFACLQLTFFVFCWQALHLAYRALLPPSWLSWGLHLEIQSTEPASAQLYFNKGDGFSEENSVFRRVAEDRWQRLFFPLPDAPIEKLRLDPIDFLGACQVRNLRLSTPLAATHRDTLVEIDKVRNGSRPLESGSSALIATSDDLNLILKSDPDLLQPPPTLALARQIPALFAWSTLLLIAGGMSYGLRWLLRDSQQRQEILDYLLPPPIKPNASFQWRQLRFGGLTFAGLFALYLTHQNSHYLSLGDVALKIEQIYHGFRNYNHPQFLLHSVDALARLTGMDETYHSITIIGRVFMAFCVAAGGTCLAWIVKQRWGLFPALCLILILAASQDLYFASHKVKEDAPLILGIGLSFLAFHHYSIRRNAVTALVLASALGLTLASKYIGGFLLLSAILALLFIPIQSGSTVSGIPSRPKLQRALGGFLVLSSALAVFYLFNADLFGQIADYRASLDRELSRQFEGKYQQTVQTPHLWVITHAVRSGWMLFPIAGIGFLVALVRKARRQQEDPWMFYLGVSYLIFALAMAFTVRLLDHYFIPAYLMYGLMLAWLIHWVLEWIASRYTHPHARRITQLGLSLLLVGFVVVPQARTWAENFEDFHYRYSNAPYYNTLVWIRDNLPRDAKLAVDRYAGIPYTDAPEMNAYKESVLPQTVVGVPAPGVFAADLGSIPELRNQGFTHVVICRGSYSRFFSEKAWEVISETNPESARRRQFYQTIMQELPQVQYWGGTPEEPEVGLYALDPIPQIGAKD